MALEHATQALALPAASTACCQTAEAAAAAERGRPAGAVGGPSPRGRPPLAAAASREGACREEACWAAGAASARQFRRVLSCFPKEMHGFWRLEASQIDCLEGVLSTTI